MSAPKGNAELEMHQASQRAAADPGLSAWVAANAGSGKTRVLVDRVIRLLLAGARPSGILCLTFTKAAAAHMALQLGKRLGEWVALDDKALSVTLQNLQGRGVAADDLKKARQLFARLLDAPGGLKLQTMHAFCEALLKRFPVEADVPPHFTIADEGRTADLLAEAQAGVLAATAQNPEFAEDIRFLAEKLSDARFASLVAALIGRRRELYDIFEHLGGAGGALEALADEFGLPADADAGALCARHVARMALADLRQAAGILLQGSKTDIERGQALADWLEKPDAARLEESWFGIFFTKAGPARAKLITDKLARDNPAALAALNEELGRLMELRGQLNACAVLRSTRAALNLAERVLAAYAALKQRHGLLDYDDLVLKSRALLSAPGQIGWVMYKLDQGIDHVLVDEAQDTSPDQWAVVAALTGDFFSGAGAREELLSLARSIFAVGDVKQSIYSFQGARPKAFLDMRGHFQRAARPTGRAFRSVPLEMSYRSTPAVLALVDAVFSSEAAKAGLAEAGEALHHRAKRHDAAGLVELWPPFVPEEQEAPQPWDAPLDNLAEDDPKRRLAEAIAAQIKKWLAGEYLPARGRPMRPGDIMILVRRRNAFFDQMVRALKNAGVPVAGADRLDLASEIAVKDLCALADACLLPEDDLTFAAMLKGPFFGFTDDDLFKLTETARARNWRGPRLWPELQRRADEHPHWQRAADFFRHWLARADFTTPFDFFAGLLATPSVSGNPETGRQRLLARLGPEAEEPVDEFLSLALQYEGNAAPSLQGFLAWFRAHAGEIKRDLEQGRDEVRVLTVHGAKGLEAPVVILPDTCDLPLSQDEEGLLWSEALSGGLGTDDKETPRPLMAWPLKSAFDTPFTESIRAAKRQAMLEEYRRLLYVALTRAEDRLYIGGYLNKRTASSGPPEDSWYSLIADGFAMLEHKSEIELPWGAPGLRYENAGSASETTPKVGASGADIALPDWILRAPPPEPSPSRPLTPSRPEREEPPPLSPLAASRGAALLRGRLIHRLLQSLPEIAPEKREAAARRLLAHPSHGLQPEQAEAILTETMQLLTHPELERLFGPQARAEAPVVGRIGESVVSGRIDRLMVQPDGVWILDYKTDRPPPERAEDVDPVYLSQMALYAALIGRIYPGRPVHAALLWTFAPRLMPLPPALLQGHTPA